VVGPTAVGKTKLSIELAQHFSTEIISADSRQFYKEMSIGTARPSVAELAAAPHHFVGHLSINEAFNAGQFEEATLELIKKVHQKHTAVIMVGGSGLYLRAVTHGLDNPPADESVRIELISELAEKGIEFLQAELLERDPASYHKIDLQNPQRLLRALETCRVSGRPYSFFLSHIEKTRSFKNISVGLNLSREELYQRINQRVDQMITDGLVNEARELYPFRHLNALNTVGYKELFEAFDGKITELEAIEKIKQNTRNFAKRQLTWFKKYSNARWFEPTQQQEITAFITQEMKA
jgi:tRNA dimethylallyltransferase